MTDETKYLCCNILQLSLHELETLTERDSTRKNTWAVVLKEPVWGTVAGHGGIT